MNQYIHDMAVKLWDYHHVNHQLEKADAILVLCSHDLRVAQRGAELFLDGWAPLLIFSGGLGVLTKFMWSEPEANIFARKAQKTGVPAECILIENQSRNTGENVHFTKQLLTECNLTVEQFILVQKPCMERRSFNG